MVSGSDSASAGDVGVPFSKEEINREISSFEDCESEIFVSFGQRAANAIRSRGVAYRFRGVDLEGEDDFVSSF